MAQVDKVKVLVVGDSGSFHFLLSTDSNIVGLFRRCGQIFGGTLALLQSASRQRVMDGWLQRRSQGGRDGALREVPLINSSPCFSCTNTEKARPRRRATSSNFGTSEARAVIAAPGLSFTTPSTVRPRNPQALKPHPQSANSWQCMYDVQTRRSHLGA